MEKSILKRFFLSYSLIFLVFISIFLFLLYAFTKIKGYGISVDHSGALRFASQLTASAVKGYYIKHCSEKGKAEDEIEKINRAKNRVKDALLALKEGKAGAKKVKDIGEEKAITLLEQIEKGYEELFSLADKVIQTCERDLVSKVDETSSKVLSLGIELTPFIAQKSVSEMNKVKITFFIAILFISAILFITYVKVKNSLKSCLIVFNDLLDHYSFFDMKGKIDRTDIYNEFEGMLNSTESLKNSLGLIMKGISHSSSTIIESIMSVKSYSTEILPLTQKIGSLVTEASQIGQEVNDLLSMIERGSEEMKIAISEISKNTLETSNRAKRLRTASTEMEEQVHNLERSMLQIREISETIKGIAEQTNLLALNASIEAARAGEAGKGFAVVANEVKELAKKVSDFIGEIEKIVGQLEEAVKDTVQKARESTLMVDEVEQATSVIAGAVEEQTAVVSGIVENTTQAKEKSFSLVSQVEELSKVKETLSLLISDLDINTTLMEEIAVTLKHIEKIIEIDERALTNEDLQKMKTLSLLKAAIIGHINWKINFINALIKGEKPKVEKDHRRCLLGRSEDYLKERLAHTPIISLLNALDTPHVRLHGFVEKVEREIDPNNKEQVWQFLQNEVLPTFNEVIKILLEMIESCKRYKCD